MARRAGVALLVQAEGSVGERSRASEAAGEPSGGRARSENAGMSSEKAGENPARRKAKDSYGRFVRVRLGGT